MAPPSGHIRLLTSAPVKDFSFRMSSTAFIAASFTRGALNRDSSMSTSFCGMRQLDRPNTYHQFAQARRRVHTPAQDPLNLRKGSGPRMDTSSDEEIRKRAWRDAIRAVIDEHVDTGKNVCIGDGNKDLLMPLLEAIDVHIHASSKVDVAFVATTAENKKLLADRNLSPDLTINYKSSIDVYIAPVQEVDNDLNVVLDSSSPASDANAAHYAKQCIFISPRMRGDLQYVDEKSRDSDRVNSITSFPIQLDSFLPEYTTKTLQKDETLKALGINGVELRPSTVGSDTIIADVSLVSPANPEVGANINVIIEELKRHPAVLGVGLHAAGKKSTVVFAASSPSSDPIDITPVPVTLANRSKELGKAAVDEGRRHQAVRDLKPWRVLNGPVSSIGATFSFQRTVLADAFVRAVHHLARVANHHPEIRQNFTQIKICLSTYDAGGVTELDILFAKELTRIYRVMSY